MGTLPQTLDSPLSVPRWHPLRHMVRGVWRQSLRRNEITVVLILLALYLIGAIVLRVVGIDSDQTARFVTGLGLELGSWISALLVIVIGTRQIPVELEQGTLYPVLAKPVTRGQVLMGKAIPTWMLGATSMGLFLLVTLAVTPHLAYQQYSVLAQAVLCKALSLALLTALTICLSLWLPSSLAMLLGGAVCFLGSMALNAVASIPAGAWLGGLIPDFKLLEQFLRYVDGGAPLGLSPQLRLLAYAVLWTATLWGLANLRFRRKSL